ncbi:hypothetical protein DP20_3732 [Shigella flexneri]|nr:hypothetical protein DP20_3732 [Shigella flexneri]
MAAEYIARKNLKTGTFPKRSEDHNLSFRKRSGQGGGDDDLLRFAAPGYLCDQLAGRLASSFGVARIYGDDLRMKEFH